MNKLLSFISLIKKSGNILNGEYAVTSAIKEERAHLVIVAKDASENTKKMYKDKTAFYNMPLVFLADKEQLGKAIGTEFTASLAICDTRLAESFLEKYRRYIDGKNESI